MVWLQRTRHCNPGGNMATYPAEIKHVKDNSLIANCSASFERMWSQNPLEPVLQITVLIKGMMTELNNTECILWIDEKKNCRVTLILLDFYGDTIETKYQAIPIGLFPSGDL